MSLKIYWHTPEEILKTVEFDKINVYKSATEQGEYALLDTIDSKLQGRWVTSYIDLSNVTASTYYWYYIRYLNSGTGLETKIYLTHPELSPRQIRLVEELRAWMPPILAVGTTEEQLLSTVMFSINNFNLYPPATNFNLDNFPYSYEVLLYLGSVIFVCFERYLQVGIKDFSYGEFGLSLNIDRGDKIQKISTQILGFYNNNLSLAKLNLMSMGTGMGTLQLPISIGANLNRGLLNVLDIFSSLGR